MQNSEHLFKPLISSSTTTTTTSTAVTATSITASSPRNHDISFSSNSGFVIRLLSIIFIGTLSLWANFEASKGFDITIINDASDSFSGQRFNLLYVSNDKATRIILNTSCFVEKLLYPDNNHYSKKQVNRVTLRLTSQNLNHNVIVNPGNGNNDFVMNLSPSVMEESDINYAVESEVLRGMTRIWLWDGECRAPATVMDGIIEYISSKAGFGRLTDSGNGGSPESDDNF